VLAKLPSNVTAVATHTTNREIGLNRNTYVTLTAAIFVLVAMAHVLRIIFGWSVEIGGLIIPFWLSWLAVLAAGALAYLGFSQRR
jgi:uncharacterized protein involved in cysteine biosynthesis